MVMTDVCGGVGTDTETVLEFEAVFDPLVNWLPDSL
jgi:hypothetical protein